MSLRTGDRVSVRNSIYSGTVVSVQTVLDRVIVTVRLDGGARQLYPTWELRKL